VIEIIQQLVVASDGLEHRYLRVFLKTFELMKNLEGVTLIQDDV
jgi:hypothetical protein